MSTNGVTAKEWTVLTDADQARTRYAFMRELCWIDWDGRPAWWWHKEHQTLLELKRAASLSVRADARPLFRQEGRP